MTEKLTLVEPSVEFQQEYTTMAQEFMATDESWFNNFPLALSDFPAFVQELQDEAAGKNLPEDVIPQQTYWLLRDDGRLLGEIRLRPHLKHPFEKYNGHLGYNIRPSERRKGYATQQLALALEKAREQGLSRVMLTVDGENPASVKVIEKHGGKLEWQRQEPETGELLSCYWIDL